jgi:peptide/nickel transport system substrate-binding protein
MLERIRNLSMLAVTLLVACDGGGSTTADKDPQEQPQPPAAEGGTRDTLVVGWQADIGQLISVVAESVVDSNILGNLSYPLVQAEFDCSLKKSPGLAKSWEWSEDGTILKMELRDDITWEDGTKVTAEDIAFTYELVADPATNSPRLSHIKRLKEDGRPKIVDPTHIEWHFTQAFDRDTQMSQVALNLVPKHIFGSADRATLKGHERVNQPLSYGPWRLAKWEPNQRIVLEPNTRFTGPEEYRPKLNRVIFRIIPEYSSRLLDLETGKIDMMEQVLVADADRLREEHPELRFVRRGWRSQDYIGWNLSNPLFEDLNVRKALALGANVDSMIQKLLTSKTGEPYARRSIGTVTPALCGVHNDDVKPVPYDVVKAKELLAEAGWKDTNGDGVLDKNGKKFEFTLLTNNGNKRRADVAVLFQDQMKELGVSVSIEKLETNTLNQRMADRDFEAALQGWAAGLFVDPSTLWGCDKKDAEGKILEKNLFNFTGYCNPELDKLMDQGFSTPNPKDAAPIWKDVQARIHADQPYLFLWWMDEIVAIHERFEHTSINVLSTIDRLHDWEVPADKVKYDR